MGIEQRNASHEFEGIAARLVSLILFLTLASLSCCHIFYDFEGTYDAAGITLDIENTSNLCLCDITIAGCDLNCQCDPDCLSNVENFRADFGFNFIGSSVDVTTVCYSMDNINLWKVNSKPSFIASQDSTTGFVCVDATSPVQDGEKVKLSTFNETIASGVENDMQSKDLNRLITSFVSSLNVASSVTGYRHNDPLRIVYSDGGAIYKNISRNGANCNPAVTPVKSPMIPIFGASTTYSCLATPTIASCSTAALRNFEIYQNFNQMTVAKTNQSAGASYLSFNELSLAASVSGTTCTISEGIKYTVMYHYNSDTLGFEIDRIYGQTLPTVSVNTGNNESFYFKAVIDFVDLDIKNFWTKTSSTPAIIPKDLAAVLESLFAVSI